MAIHRGTGRGKRLDLDVRLVEQAMAGDREAFRRVYERYEAMVHGILISQVRPQEAQDLVQEVFLKALRKIGGLREPDRLGGWLAAIARNMGRDAIRSRRPTEGLPENLEGPPNRDSTASMAVLDVMRSLPEAYRETLALRLVEGMTGPEIAERTGLTPGSVRVNLTRGMRLLRERLTEKDLP